MNDSRPEMPPNPFEPPTSLSTKPSSAPRGQRPPGPVRRAFVWTWGLVVAIAGGYVSGLAINAVGELGSLSLWGLGGVAGYVGYRLLGSKSRPVGLYLFACVVAAGVVAEVSWLHWNIKQAAESWWTAFTLLPAFVRQYTTSALIAGLFAFFGGTSAYTQTARRYRFVALLEE